MSAISGINTGYSNLWETSGSDDVSMGKEDFLKLLVAQLENQDPMNPDDPTEFTAQLAQFSQLEQLTNVNKSLEGLTSMSTEMQRMSALGLVGQEIIAQSAGFHYREEPLQLGYRLAAPAEDVTLYVLNQSGSTVATLHPEATAAGDHFIEWDGTDDSGTPLDEGDYALVIKAEDADEEAIETESLIRGRVETVDMGGSETLLETSSGIFPMGRLEKAGAV